MQDSFGLCEAAGSFLNSDAYYDAIDELISSGFDFADMGLLACACTVREFLGDYYVEPDAYVGAPGMPRVVFVPDRSMGDTVHTQLGDLFFTGATRASGAIVSSAAVLGGMLVSGVDDLDSHSIPSLNIHPGDSGEIENQVDAGRLLLFVRALDASEKDSAIGILSGNGGRNAKLYRSIASWPC